MITDFNPDGTPIGAKPNNIADLRVEDYYNDLRARFTALEDQVKGLYFEKEDKVHQPYSVIERVDKLERLCWEMNKERGTDGLAWEQDMLNANRRIEALEKEGKHTIDEHIRVGTELFERAEVERLTDVLDNTARECAEEEIRLGSCINDMNNDNRELRAEIERLRAAMLEAQTLCANDRGGNAIYLIRDALSGKEPHDPA
jgi:hypothetical protein